MNQYLFSLLSGATLLMVSVSAVASTDIVAVDGANVGTVNFADIGNNVTNTVVNDLSASAQSEWNNIVSQVASPMNELTSGVTSQVSGLTSQVSGLTSGISGVSSQVTGALDLASNPQGLLTMATGGLSWSNVTSLAMGAAQEALMGFVNIPPVGIPVADPILKGHTAAEQAAKSESAELDKKISEEQKKQVDAIGARPATQASEGTPAQQAVAANPTEEPSVDTCPALMASYPRQSQKAYEFVKKYILDENKPSQYAAPQKTMAQAVQYVEQNFFIKDTALEGNEKSKLTLEEMQKVKEKRYAYQRDVIADILASGIGTQKFLVEDAKSISMAPTSGCNEIDDLNVGTMIMISMAKQTIADIVLQMKLMEFEGVKRIYDAPVKLLDNPQKEEQAAEAAQ